MKYDSATPYIAAYVLLRRDDKLAFVLRENTGWMDGYYSLPSGKIEKAESFLTGAVREAHEEVGVTIEPANLQPLLTVHRNANDVTEWIDIYFEATSWTGEPYNAEPEKHRELTWLDPKDLPESVIPSIRQALEQIAAGSIYTELGWKTNKN